MQRGEVGPNVHNGTGEPLRKLIVPQVVEDALEKKGLQAVEFDVEPQDTRATVLKIHRHMGEA